MTDKQSTRYELLARFYELQKAIDSTTDSDLKATLEAQKKELATSLEAT